MRDVGENRGAAQVPPAIDKAAGSPPALNDGGPAFPIPNGLEGEAPGMSLRDWFAGQALVGLYGGRGGAGVQHRAEDLAIDAEIAYRIAAEMLKVRTALAKTES